MPPHEPERIAICKRFGMNLLIARRARNLSQDDVAERSGFHRIALSETERGLRDPRLGSLVRLAASVSVPYMELLDGMEWCPGVVPVARDAFRPDLWTYELPPGVENNPLSERG